MYGKMVIPLLALLLVFSTGWARMSAQESDSRGVIAGTITDANGALIPGAGVTIVNTDTGVSTSEKSNGSGYYELRQLVPGHYNVTVQVAGFKTEEYKGIYVDAGKTVPVNAALKVGTASSSIEVVANQDLLNTEEGTNVSIVDQATVEQTPMPDNNAMLMEKLAMGTQSTDPISSSANGTMFANGGNSSFGVYGMYKADTFYIDGAPNESYSHQEDYAAPVEEVKQVNTETAGFDATIGHGLGGQVNIVSKNGTSKFHGSARDEYEDLRWQPLNRTARNSYIANTAIPCAPPNENSAACQAAETKYGQLGLHNMTYAGSIGGPVEIPHLFHGKDKLFFFFDYMNDHFPLLTQGQQTVPTSQELTGNFSDLPCPISVASGTGAYGSPYVFNYSSGACPGANSSWGYGQYQVYDPLTTQPDGHGGYIRQPFAGNIIPAGRQTNPLGPYMAKIYRPANTASIGSSLAGPTNLTYSLPRPQSYWTYAPRIDFDLNPSNHFFFKLDNGHYQVFNPDVVDTANLDVLYNGRLNLVLTGAWDHTFSQHLTMTTTVAYNRYNGPGGYPNAHVSDASLGLPAYLDAQQAASNPVGAPSTPTVNSYDSLSFTSGTFENFSKSISGNADAVGVFGRHSLKFGVAYQELVWYQPSNANANGTLTYDNTYTSLASDASSYISTGSSEYGPAYGAFLLGFNTSATQTVGALDTRSNPFYSVYVQDAWHVKPRLTINAGLRWEAEEGPVEAKNRQVGPFSPTQTLAIAPGANAAYSPSNYTANSTALAAAGLPSTLPTSLNVVGGATYPGVNGVSPHMWQTSVRLLPRVAFAFSATPKTVLRAGYGLFFDSLNTVNEGNDSTGFSVTTTQPSSLTAGTSWVAPGVSTGTTVPTLNPFPNGFSSPFGNTGGNLIYAGGSQSFYPYNIVPARQQRWQGSIQHQLDAHSVLTFIYAGAYTSKISVFTGSSEVGVNLNPVPAAYYITGQTTANAQANALNALVTNPFYIGNLTGLSATQTSLLTTGPNAAFFNSKTVALNQLLKPYPHLSGLTQYSPVAESKFNSLELNYSRRFVSNFNLTLDYQRIFQYDRDWFANAFDQLPSWEDSVSNSRPSRFTGTGIYKFPVGHGQRYLQQGVWQNSVISTVVSGWQMDGSYEVQQGPLVTFGNVFYAGCTTSWQTCDTTGLRIKHPSYGEWFNTAGFNTTSTPGTYNLRVFPRSINGVRQQGDNNLNLNIMKVTPIKEGVNFEMRLEALDVFNRTVAGGPNTTPTSTQFGQVTSDLYSSARWVQIQGKITF
ncbi:MAG: carboxypeptidase regulatory-like domain-containing protein [Terracidiphilus sp.]